MKVFIIALIIFFTSLCSYAESFYCPAINSAQNTEETFLNKYAGLNFTSRKIAESIIEKELGEELNSKINAQLEIYNISTLKNGEFKSLKLKSKQINYRTFSVSDVYAETICSYNKVIYENSRLYYPYDMPFHFNAVITNEDIGHAIASEDFQNEIVKKPVKLNGTPVLYIETPVVEIQNGKLFYDIPVKTFLGSLRFKFNSGIKVKNNAIILTDIGITPLNGLINPNIFKKLSQNINPMKYQLKALNGKYCKIFITNAQISDNIINVEGVFVVNKNYTVGNE